MPVKASRLLPLAAVVMAGVACWVWFRLYTGIRLEDALITWRYARHLAEGQGFVFNPGERVLGTTTPLLTMMLGLAGAIVGVDRIPVAANALMMLAAAGAGVMTCLALEAFGCARGLALFAAAALLLNPEMLWMTGGGMETPLVLFFMAASLWALARHRHTLAAGAAALLVLTRIDGLFWAAGVLVCLAWSDRAALRRWLTVLAGLLVPWIVFAFAYFGGPIPNSIIAKRVIGNTYDLTALPHLLEHLDWCGPFFAWSVPFSHALGWLAFAAGALSIFSRRSPAALRLVVVFPMVFCAALYLGRAPLWFDWYLAPVGYTALIVGGVGVWFVSGHVAILTRRHLSMTRSWPLRTIAALLLAGCVYLTAQQARQVAEFQKDYQTNEDGTRRVIGQWLHDNTPANAVVAMEAVGYQAWYADRKVVDLAGLVSPAVVQIRRASRSNAEAFYTVLRDLRPDYLVLRSFEVDRNAHYHGGPLFESTEQVAYFGSHYEEARRFEAPLPRFWGETSRLTVYRRIPERADGAPREIR